MSQEQKQLTIIDAVNTTFNALELAQKRGAYTFEESTAIFHSIKMMKQFFEEINKQQLPQKNEEEKTQLQL